MLDAAKYNIVQDMILDTLKEIYADSLLKNSSYLIASNFFGMILGFFFWMIATRYYTPNDIGITSAILSSMLLISTASLIGLPSSLTFYLPIYKKESSKKINRIINSCMIVTIIISIILSLIFVLGIDMLSPELKHSLEDPKLIMIFIITTIMTTISTLMSGIFTAGKRSSFHMVKENIFGFTKIFPLILLAGSGIIGIFLSWSIGLVITMIVGSFLLFKLWKYIPMFTFDPIIKNMANFSFGNYVAGILHNLPKFLFPIIIVNSISAESAGYFFIAMTIAGLLYGIPTSTVGPFLAECYNKDKFWNNVNKTIKFNISLLIPGLLFFMIFGKFVLDIFNPKYTDSSFMTLIILSVTSIPLSLIVIFNTIRLAQNKIISTIKINGIVSSIAISLSLLFIKDLNIEGVALAYLIANSITAIIIIFRMKDSIDLKAIKNDTNIIIQTDKII